MNPEEERAHLQRMIDELVRLLPDGWHDARLTYRAVGDYEVIRLVGHEEDPYQRGIFEASRLLPQTGIPDMLRRHREMTHHPDDGAWMSLAYSVRGGAEAPVWSVEADPPEEFPWADEVTPADAATELARYPRPDDRTPQWLAHLAALHTIGQAFDPETLRQAPQAETDLARLLPPGLEDLFTTARAKLADYVPGVDRLRAGTIADGCWTIAHTTGAWLAIGPDSAVHPFGDPRAATVHAMAGVMADAGMEINSQVLLVARVLRRNRVPRKRQDAWTLASGADSPAAGAYDSVRPAGPGPYIALDALANRPGGYFVCFPGPRPEDGAFISVHDIYGALAGTGLPTAVPEPAPEPEPRPEPPSEILPVGKEVDTYHPPADRYVFDIGTPWERRGHINLHGLTYRVYRVQKPLRGYNALFHLGPIGSGTPPPETGMGYNVVHSIADLVASGHLVEITGPGGEPGPTVQPPEEQT
ncbi:glycohydrolase toxin TNT-related protein [Actinomadura opuntiae]|uniref:glycohydrolase toxin TNT-related protein n=1 Tax=Actinomadura sp. OS1-43 TaxID=604315 RepID=UPI00255A9553|nr:glycohydrolase toxin TNT-related protein [Actinomadura sp. OS1-43]MDL4814890.1 glycohydrolase toxin TNT-related protein [Actinomadura sp. OS1-43]